ncbi:hypothetical protein K443DRAFT_171086 [Laccaria amethystina LaAM-08-1]|uniref:Unplaced genomic scaffold K443scaffold_110, whole genome shotgun sequence n=1 Tax=Laccaria amethystina LaAM-08-1 TaxID=1095629 RepID=A0A0C9XDE0_9AGAR|nr:hypothetical protein K443DRAFT_171086 [Laccaria amethystina LaAM-08-1]
MNRRQTSPDKRHPGFTIYYSSGESQFSSMCLASTFRLQHIPSAWFCEDSKYIPKVEVGQTRLHHEEDYLVHCFMKKIGLRTSFPAQQGTLRNIRTRLQNYSLHPRRRIQQDQPTLEYASMFQVLRRPNERQSLIQQSTFLGIECAQTDDGARGRVWLGLYLTGIRLPCPPSTSSTRSATVSSFSSPLFPGSNG